MPFRDILGHRHVLQLLSRAVARGSLPPSLIFAGPEGVGKRLTAVAVAQALNCPQPVLEVAVRSPGPGGDARLERDACGTCSSCRRIARSFEGPSRIHPDILILEPDDDGGAIKIEAVRDLIDQVGYRPFEASRRVVVIDRAEALVLPAQHALLKTLEEPPSGSIFILVTAQPDELLPTVRSRCPQIRFGPLTPGDVARCLVERHGRDPGDARALAAVADGSPGRALAAESASLTAARQGAERLLRHLAQARDPRRRLGAAGEILGKSPKGSGASERESVSRHLRVLHGLLRDLGVLSSRAGEPALANEDLKPTLTGLLPAFDRDRLAGAFTAVDRALWALDHNASPKVVADWLVLRI